MKHPFAALIIASAVILATDLRAQESVCDLVSHLEKSDGRQLTLTGDLIISKDIAVFCAADSEYHYSSESVTYPAAVALHPSAAVIPAESERFQKAATDVGRFRPQRKTVRATPTFSGRIRIAPAGEIPAEFIFDSFENLIIEALPDAASLDAYNVLCAPGGKYRAYGYGHLNAAVAELIAESIRDLEVTPRPDTPINPHQVNPERHCVPPSRAELCAKADTLPRAAQRGCADKVRELLAANGIDSKNGSESEALTTAIRAGNKDIVEILLQAGAPLNPRRTALWPPLSDAAFTKHFEIMKLLLQSGAKVDAPDHQGDTLLVSTGFFDPTVTTILLEAGANPDASDREGQTPLMKASARGFKQSAKILLDHHADVNRKDVKGRTALMHAAASRVSDAIAVLLENGADPNAHDNEGKTALDLADKSNNLGAIAMLSLAVKRPH